MYDLSYITAYRRFTKNIRTLNESVINLLLHRLYSFRSGEREKELELSIEKQFKWKFSSIYSVYDYGLMESTA